MLPFYFIRCGPYFNRDKGVFDIIQMPVGAMRRLQVVGQPGFQAPGAEGAAHIDIIAGLEFEDTELSYDQPFFSFGPENQCICSGVRVHAGNDE